MSTAEEILENIGKGLIVRPGDTLVVTFARRINEEEFHEMIEMLKVLMPGVNVVIFPEVSELALIPGGGHDAEV